MEAVGTVEDPDIGYSLVELGLIYDVTIAKNNDISIAMTLTSPTCPIAPYIIEQIEVAVKKLDNIGEIKINIVWDPPWNPAEMAADHVKDAMGIW
jgi:metal-sulfur cluster biosynthetic enzyme